MVIVAPVVQGDCFRVLANVLADPDLTPGIRNNYVNVQPHGHSNALLFDGLAFGHEVVFQSAFKVPAV
jgi:hypothetical protein